MNVRSFLLERRDPLRVSIREIEMDLPHPRIERGFSRCGLVSLSTSVINQVCFHDRHPPMACDSVN